MSLLVSPGGERVVTVFGPRGEFVGWENLPTEIVPISRSSTSEGKWSSDVLELLVPEGWTLREPAQSWEHVELPPLPGEEGSGGHVYCPDCSSLSAMKRTLGLEDVLDDAFVAWLQATLPKAWRRYNTIRQLTRADD